MTEDDHIFPPGSYCPLERTILNSPDLTNQELEVQESRRQTRQRLYAAKSKKEREQIWMEFSTKYGLFSNILEDERPQYRELKAKIVGE